MADEIVQVEDGAVKLALEAFGLSLRSRAMLLKDIAAGMLVSVRRTFREQGVPANSWAPLAPSTLKSKASKATAGRKILILSGRLLNSIQATATPTGVVIGTNLVYARVQQLGSADRGGSAALGPRTEELDGRRVLVPVHSRARLREIHYGTRQVVNRQGKVHHVPVGVRTGMREITDAKGHRRKVRTRFHGPQQQTSEKVSAHERHQNIPPRPYLVVRPEDPSRIRAQVVAFSVRQAVQSGLQASGGI